MIRIQFLILNVMVLCLLIGCNATKSAPVSGIVTINGKPAANIQVTFQPKGTGEKGIAVAPGAAGITDANGRYELRLAVVDKTVMGAGIGKNKVIISMTTPAKKEGVPTPKFKSVLPGGVMLIETEFDVPKGGTTEANFSLPLK